MTLPQMEAEAKSEEGRQLWAGDRQQADVEPCRPSWAGPWDDPDGSNISLSLLWWASSLFLFSFKMTPAGLWLRIFFIGFVLTAALLLVTLWTPAPYGDLSRLGQLSEHEFGWREPPPALPLKLMRGVPMDKADVLVVGDSFSMTFAWQTALARAGYRVTTIYWGHLPGLCKDFSQWVMRAGFRGELIVVQSIERLLAERLDRSEACDAMPPGAPKIKLEPFIQPLLAVPGFKLNVDAKLTTGLITYRNTRRARKSPDVQFADRVRVRTVPDGCAYFSHRLCEKALFFPEDSTKVELSERMVKQMEAFNRAHRSIPVLWMVVPDKTTVYVEPEHSARFVAALNAARLGPDLFAAARHARRTVRDLYFPNDTHLSMHGQLWVGELMLAVVRETVGRSSSKLSCTVRDGAADC